MVISHSYVNVYQRVETHGFVYFWIGSVHFWRIWEY